MNSSKKPSVFVMLVWCLTTFVSLALCNIEMANECAIPEKILTNQVQVNCANRCISSRVPGNGGAINFSNITPELEYALLTSENATLKWRLSNRVTHAPDIHSVNVDMTNCNLTTQLVLNAIKDIDFQWNGKLHLNGANEITSYLLDGFEQIVDLQINNMPSTSFFNETVFANLNRLLELKLINSSISQLSDYMFQSQTELITLDMTDNDLVLLPETVFDNTKSLQFLYLGGNSLLTIPSTLLHNVIELRGLSLARNQLEEIDSVVFKKMTALQTLDLSNNRLDTIHSGALDELINLEFLDLSNNVLESLPNGIFANTKKMRYLLLRANRLQSIQLNFIGSLGELEILALSSNRLSSLNMTADRLISFGNTSDRQSEPSTYNVKSISTQLSVKTKFILNGNPWECDCDGAFINFIETLSHRVDYDRITCADDVMIGDKIDACANRLSTKTTILHLIRLIIVFVIIAVIIAIWWKIRTTKKKIDNFSQL